MRLIALALLLAIICPAGLSAQPSSHHSTRKALVVGVWGSPPFVMRDAEVEGRYHGLAIDIWNEVARGMNIESVVVGYSSLRELLAETVAGNVDIAVSNLTVTEQRARQLAFSFSWYEGGMRLIARSDHKTTLWEGLVRDKRFRTYASLLLIILAVTVALTIVRRRYDANFPRRWIDGLSTSFYDLISAARSGNISRKMFGWVGNILAAVWLLFGVTLVAYVTSTITATMTTTSLTARQAIHSLGDLPGRMVGILDNSPAETIAEDLRLTYIPYQTVEETGQALLDGKVEAWFHDAPVLEYWLAQHSERAKDVMLAGPTFHPEKYAFASGISNLELMNSVSYHLIRLYETGQLETMKAKYFSVE